MGVLLADWTGPYGGQLPFDKVKVAAFEPALTAAMTQNLTEIDTIASNPEAPTFDNTIAAQERSGRPFTRVTALYGVWTSSLNTPEMNDVQDEMEPKLAAFQDKIDQNAPLFARIEAVYNAREKKELKLTPEQQRLTWVYWGNAFVRAGAKLDAKSKARVAEINQRLAGPCSPSSGRTSSPTRTRTSSTSTRKPTSPACRSRSGPERRRPPRLAGTRARVSAILNTRSSMEPFLTYRRGATCARKSGGLLQPRRQR